MKLRPRQSSIRHPTRSQLSLNRDRAAQPTIAQQGQLLLQDVQRGGTGDNAGDAANADVDGEVRLKEGVSKDRMVSVHDPRMRHGHKSKSRRFDGHKAEAVDAAARLITAADMLPGNAASNLGALEVNGAERCQCRRAGGGGYG